MLFVGSAIAADYFAGDSDQLRATGNRVSGTVFLVSPDTRYSSGYAVVEYTVRGQLYREQVDLGSDADGYRAGESVVVYFDAHDPSHMTIDDEDNQPGQSVLPMEVAFVAAVALMVFGLILGVRGWRGRDVPPGRHGRHVGGPG